VAHSTDYASRVAIPQQHIVVVSNQVMAAIRARLVAGWSDSAIQEYCMLCYADMGLTRALYEQLMALLKTR